MPTRYLYDIWNNEVAFSESHIAHRNRSIYVEAIQTIQAKGRRLLINTYKRNASYPTMCVFFEDAKQAQYAYQVACAILFHSGEPVPLEEDQTESDAADEPEVEEESNSDTIVVNKNILFPYYTFLTLLIAYLVLMISGTMYFFNK